MSKTKALATLGLAAAGLFFFGGQAAASDSVGIPFGRELEACVAEIGDYANYEDATRVRHLVSEVRRRVNGYVLSIDTSVYTDTGDVATREYVTLCLARGDARPARFRISETGSGG